MKTNLVNWYLLDVLYSRVLLWLLKCLSGAIKSKMIARDCILCYSFPFKTPARHFVQSNKNYLLASIIWEKEKFKQKKRVMSYK